MNLSFETGKNMNDDELTRKINAIRGGRDTPCVGVCNSLYVDNCQGCGRTATEDSFWSVMSPEEKDAVWARIIQQGWRPGVGLTRTKQASDKN